MDRATQDRQRILADAALMGAIAGGDSAAFARLMRDLGPRLLRLAAPMLGDGAEAEDVLQEAFLRLWRAAPDWRPSARIGTWLHTVVYRLALDRLRARRNHVALDAVEDQLPVVTASAEENLVDRNRREVFERALAQLPARQRAALVLAYDEDLSQAEASAVLGCTQEAYESLLARGRRRLREIVSAGASEEGDGHER